MKKVLLIMLALLMVSSAAMAGSVLVYDQHRSHPRNTHYVGMNHFATNADIEDVMSDMTKRDSVSTAMASLELDPTRNGLSMALGLGVADFSEKEDKFGEAIGFMYGVDGKAVNLKVGKSGSYTSVGIGFTVGF